MVYNSAKEVKEEGQKIRYAVMEASNRQALMVLRRQAKDLVSSTDFPYVNSAIKRAARREQLQIMKKIRAREKHLQ